MVLVSGMLEGCPAKVVLEARVSSRVQQHLDDLGIAAAGGSHEGCVAITALLINVHPGFE